MRVLDTPLPRRAHFVRSAHACFGLALVVGAVTCASTARAQAGAGLDDAAFTMFGRRDGLPDAALLSLHPARDGGILVASSEGVYRFTGSRWVAESLPPRVPTTEYRAVFDGADGVRYFVHRAGVVLQRGGQWIANVRLDDSLTLIFSAVEWQRPDGQHELVVGATSGVYRLVDRARFARVALPNGMTPLDAMVAVQRIGDEDALWIGTRGGGVARLRAGLWNRWTATQGLADLRVEHLAMAVAGDSARAVVATEGGAFIMIGDRWRPLGPRVSMARALRVRIGDKYETWLGAFSGELFRVADGGAPALVELSGPTRGSRPQVLTAIDHGMGWPTIYAGFRSGALLRFQVGVAGRLLLPPSLNGRPVFAMADAMDEGGIWSSMLGVGGIRLPDLKRVPVTGAMLSGRVRIQLVPVRGPPRVLLSTDRRLFLSGPSGWKQLLDLEVGNSIFDLGKGPAPDASIRPVIATLKAGFYLDENGALVPWPGFPSAVRAIVTDSSMPVPSLVTLGARGELYRSRGSAWSTIAGGAAPIGGAMNAITSWRFPSGECALIAGSSEGLAVLRTCGGAASWRVVTARTLPGLTGNEVNDLAVLPDGRLAIGSNRGLVIMQLGRSFNAPYSVVTSISDADGLPNSTIFAIGPIDAQGRLWVGTPEGAGFLNLRSLRRTAPPPVLRALDIRDGNGDAVFAGRRIPSNASRIDVEVQAATYHREDDTRYRFELDGVAIHKEPWTYLSTATQLALPAGEHVVRVRAIDFREGESVALERRFSVLPPSWRSPWALLAYAFGLVGLVVTVDRLRTRSARQRAADAEANERRLATSEERFRRLFLDGESPQILILDGKIWQANTAAEALLPAIGTSLESRPIMALLPDIGDGLSSATPMTWPRELDGVGPNGARIPLEVSHMRIPLGDATLDHLKLIDLRERKRLERERRELEEHLRNAQRLEAVGTLAGGVAHDFNNLLTVIYANAELALADVAPSAPAADALQQLLIASRRAREVVRQILTYSRQTPSTPVDVRMAALLDEMQSLLGSILPSTVTLVLDNQAPDAMVHGDPTQLQQLLLNLGANAEHAMRETNGGVLTVSLGWATDVDRLAGAPTVFLRVSDTGGGMSEAVRARALEPFFTTKPVGEGTGLGLSVLHGIVGAHGGTVTLQSTLDRGTTVEVRLPAHTSQDVDIPAVSSATQSPSDGKRVLVVDDEVAVTRVVQMLLRQRGYDVEIANTGTEVLHRLQQQPDIDILITDQTMPVMTGTILIEQLRAQSRRLPIILMSGFGVVMSDERMAELQPLHRLDKPFTVDELLRVLERCASLQD